MSPGQNKPYKTKEKNLMAHLLSSYIKQIDKLLFPNNFLVAIWKNIKKIHFYLILKRVQLLLVHRHLSGTTQLLKPRIKLEVLDAITCVSCSTVIFVQYLFYFIIWITKTQDLWRYQIIKINVSQNRNYELCWTNSFYSIW